MEYLESLMNFFKGGEGMCSCLLYTVYVAAMFVGGSQLILFVYSTFEFLHRHIIRKPYDLNLRYA